MTSTEKTRAPASRTTLVVGALVAIVAAGVGPAMPAEATSQGGKGRIAFVGDADGDLEIYTMNPYGGELTQLTANTAPDDQPEWSPDGQRIAFVSRRNGGNREIYVMDADGSNQTRLTNSPASDTVPSWSPNGKKILFASSRDGDFEIYLMDADGTNVRQLTDNSASDGRPQFSPNGAKIAFISDRGAAIGMLSVWVMSADGTGARRLTSDDLGGGTPSWSPDGEEIALVNNCCVNENSDILVRKANGRIRRLTASFDNNSTPSWSPDGRMIAFDHGVLDLTHSDPVLMPTDIYVMNRDGTRITQLTHTGEISEFFADWGPPSASQ